MNASMAKLAGAYFRAIRRLARWQDPDEHSVGQSAGGEDRLYPGQAVESHNFAARGGPALVRIFQPFRIYSIPVRRHNGVRSIAMHVLPGSNPSPSHPWQSKGYE